MGAGERRPVRRAGKIAAAPAPPPKAPVDSRDPRDRNNEKAFAAVRKWAAGKGIDAQPILDRLALALLTESSGGYIYANDGTYFKEGSPARNACLLSLAIPHDKVGHDGGSTGPLQQWSKEVNDTLGRGWNWGSMADTMDPAKAALAFVEELRITSDRWYQDPGSHSRTLTVDPVVADVLRVQQPSLAAAMSANYSAAQVELARQIARGGTRFFTDRSAQ